MATQARLPRHTKNDALIFGPGFSSYNSVIEILSAIMKIGSWVCADRSPLFGACFGGTIFQIVPLPTKILFWWDNFSNCPAPIC
jgi:hypothetical protein